MDRRLVRALDLVDDAGLMREYRRRHAQGAVWPEVIAHIRALGVEDMEIWCTGSRLVMIMTVSEDYPRNVSESARVTDWELQMDSFQQRLPGVAAGEKWAAMTRIFALEESGRLDE